MSTSHQLSEKQRLGLLEPPARRVRMVLDTDTYNEIDDQFALAYGLLSPERIEFKAVYAAPFHNKRSNGPEHGMELSFDEILRVLERVKCASQPAVFKGARRWMEAPDRPVMSEAVEDLIERAKAGGEEPLYVAAIGAITNVASAIAAAPEIIGKIVVVWLGGQPSYWHSTAEFNLQQDRHASRIIFDSGVPVVWMPCINVAQQIKTTQAELERFMKGRSEIGDFLFESFSAYTDDHFGWSKEIWDLGPIAWLVNPGWTTSALVHSPMLSEGLTWSHSPYRHFVREIRTVNRDAIFRDLFRKLEGV